MDPAPATLTQPHSPATLCGYPIQRVLTPNTSYLALADANRPVVLKRVDDDCMLGKALHPSIVDRLGRVREVAHAGVANLIGVERDCRTVGQDSPDAKTAWLVWDYVPGQTLLEWAQNPAHASRELLVMARELILSVEQLHMRGLVHGALIRGNVIVEPTGSLKLTHVSPLLYTDMNVDVESVIGLLKEVAHQGGVNGAALQQVLDRADQGERGLRALGARVAGALGGGVVGGEGDSGGAGEAERRVGWMVAQVIAVAAVGVAVAYGVWRVFER